MTNKNTKGVRLKNKPEKRSFGLKKEIPVGMFMGFVLSFLWFIWLFNTDDIEYFRNIITAWLLFWSPILLFGFDKGSIFQFGASMVKLLMNNSLTSEKKLALLMNVLQQWLGLAADLSQFINAEKKTST